LPPENRSRDRRRLIRYAGAGLLGLLAGEFAIVRGAGVPSPPDPFRSIEKAVGGRVGVMALDTGSGKSLQSRPDERFPMCSTFKWLLAAAVLSRAELGTLSLDRRVSLEGVNFVGYSPVTRERGSSRTISIEELCSAAVEDSDNTAANLLLTMIDGPAGLTRFLRSIGDTTTRLDRNEPTLNDYVPGDDRDTTTPRAMVSTINTLLLGTSTALALPSRQRLIAWLKDCKTGLERLRAGLPADWVTADKTGTGDGGSVNDLAISWPPGRAPILIACYLNGSKQSVDSLSAAHVDIARIVADEFARS
jgi:beta-lactamase class A